MPWGPPGPCPWFQPPLFSSFPASGPGGDAPWPPPGLAPAPGGGHKSGILWGWQSHRRCHQRPGSGTVPKPLSSCWGDRPRAVPCGAHHGPGAVPASCWSRATRPRGCFNAGGGARDWQCRPQTHSGTRVVPGRERGEALGGLLEASLLSPSPSAPPFPRPCAQPPGGYLRVGDLGGLLGQAAALGGDQVVVFGDVLVRIVQAAGAGPRWGPWGQEGGAQGRTTSGLCQTPGPPRAITAGCPRPLRDPLRDAAHHRDGHKGWKMPSCLGRGLRGGGPYRV